MVILGCELLLGVEDSDGADDGADDADCLIQLDLVSVTFAIASFGGSRRFSFTNFGRSR